MTLDQLQKSNYTCPGQLSMFGGVGDVCEVAGWNPKPDNIKKGDLNMKIKINGNVASLISNIDFEDLKKSTAVSPMFIRNEQGKKVYGVGTGPVGTINEAGICFSYGNAEGKAALNVCFCPSASTEEITEEILDSLAGAIDKFTFFEEAIIAAMDERTAARNQLAASIEIG